ncbi:unnamed protein product [Adineta steineri]|nr:unnamed protein product [Adineta steineri]
MYVGVFILVIGILGNIFNILVLLSLKIFRENSCAFYIKAMSCLNIGQLLASLLPRILNLWFSIDWSVASLAYCKIRMYVFQVCTVTSFTCMCLATIDQYLTTCSYPRLQRLSNIKFAYRCFTIVMLFWILHGILVLTYTNYVVLSPAGDYICGISNKIYQNYNTYGFTLVLISSLPVLITVISGSLAYHNVTQLAYRAIPLVRRELDKQLTVMVLVQVVFNFCVIVPYIIGYMINLYANVSKDSYSYAQIQLLRSITINTFYSYFASSFYIFITVSERFRKQFIHVIFGMYIKRNRRRQRRMTINPMAVIT